MCIRDSLQTAPRVGGEARDEPATAFRAPVAPAQPRAGGQLANAFEEGLLVGQVFHAQPVGEPPLVQAPACVRVREKPLDLRAEQDAAAFHGVRKLDVYKRQVLAEVETDISSMLVDAANVYDENELAVRLRTMHLLYESVKNSGGTVVIPSAYSEGFADAGLDRALDSLKTGK